MVVVPMYWEVFVMQTKLYNYTTPNDFMICLMQEPFRK
jgi:hypothetical protein